MNQRIRELVEQAGIEIEHDDYGDDTSCVVYSSSLEKLVNLVVKECISMCDGTLEQYLRCRLEAKNLSEKNVWAAGETASHLIKHKMKKYFDIA